MLHSILRSLRGSLVELTKCEPVSNQSEIALRSGLEKSVLFLLCSSAIMGTSALILGMSQQPVYCDKGLAFWNGLLGAILVITAVACSTALFFDTEAINLMAKLIWTNGESSFFEFGTTAFNISACLAGGPLLALIWIMRGAIELTSSPTCRTTAPLLYGGSIANITLTISALTFASLMISYYIASSKRFYDIAILSCVCDPISVMVEGVAEHLPEPPRIRHPEFVPSFNGRVAKLLSYERIGAFVRRILDALTPDSSLPQRFNSLVETRVY
ncbi:uncharacterized protein LOC34622108 [Cyclospora cayetanensis]|uniref:Uncharacterized protein LOC34622108 n=1 Tax=Cyclospora cayetanensis TaxID=88456 RepID=A0A6P6RQJ4_9EIME|nr:uncharacterized protein LOC34622108 [Cyclospora cayetanensis]